MKNISVNFIIILGLIIFYSCNSSVPKECIERADSLKQQLDIAHKEFLAIPYAEYDQIHKKVKETNAIFKTHIFNIKDETFKTTFSQYTDLEKEYKRILKRYKNIAEEFDVSIKQIDNIKEDMKSGALNEKDKIEIYLNQEKAAMQYLTQTMKDLFVDAEKQKNNFLQSKEAVEKFAEELVKN
ncbi:MAG: hypothetical protein A2309_09180 [Bacteroidetes bacterium RIFOXYB2_FULL_35_7]|nr:MAG: hypothetical protein A2X01_04795 [Bacteroidetes bacterium GWF2_35_48]OFY96510.1 MAG: hypothetical protein A2309_09180 [Bacteroidetes bacterium RIFOXYB2_FULL_35_7]OFZ06244.1 MAG: hypothetical protein A2491_13475 [Bacteroidetes bacterium RIFOXYC12_FULL_35_7]HBX51974.1 hypothetical protein [Bacteroidales bacterium]